MQQYKKIDRILKLPEVVEVTHISKSTIYELLKTNEFPAQIRLTKRSVGWRESDIVNFINSRSKVNNI